MAITAFALFLALPLWAQHGGGHGGGFGGGHSGFSGGGHAGFSGHSSFSGGSHFSGSHFSSGAHSASGVSRSFSGNNFSSNRPGFSRGSFLHDGFRGRDGFNRGFGYRGRFGWNRFGNCYGYGCWGGYPYAWWGGGYYDPWLWDWWSSDSSYDDDYNNNLAIANQMDEESYERQQQMLRQEQEDGDQDLYLNAPRPVPSRNDSVPVQPQPTEMFPATVLIFRDQHQQEIKNYAIIGQTLWNFAPQRTQRIPLSELDLPATEKINDDHGVTFRIPNAGEAQ